MGPGGGTGLMGEITAIEICHYLGCMIQIEQFDPTTTKTVISTRTANFISSKEIEKQTDTLPSKVSAWLSHKGAFFYRVILSSAVRSGLLSSYGIGP